MFKNLAPDITGPETVALGIYHLHLLFAQMYEYGPTDNNGNSVILRRDVGKLRCFSMAR